MSFTTGTQGVLDFCNSLFKVSVIYKRATTRISRGFGVWFKKILKNADGRGLDFQLDNPIIFVIYFYAQS